jgi:hypothetical protein
MTVLFKREHCQTVTEGYLGSTKIKFFSLKSGDKFKYCTPAEITLRASSLIAHAISYGTDQADTIFFIMDGPAIPFIYA